MDASTTKCMVCEEEQSKYSCPRCCIRYCSLTCYQHQTHAECSESFYKQQVMNELKEMKGTGDDKDKIVRILKKMKDHDESAKNIDDVSQISERLDGVDLDDAGVVWEKLISRERELFRSYLSKGNLDFLPKWTPWWCVEQRCKIVDLSRGEGKRTKHLPKTTKNLPKLDQVLGDKPPDPNLKYCAVELLLTYLCTQRIFNGDWSDSPDETVDVILQLSKVLTENKIYSDLESCLYCFINDVIATSNIDVDPVVVCLQDLELVVTSDDSCVVRAMSDFYTYLRRCQKTSKNENADLSRRLFKMWKKVYFFVIYCGEYESDIKMLAGEIREIQRRLSQDRAMMEKQKKEIEEHINKFKPKAEGVLIEEVP